MMQTGSPPFLRLQNVSKHYGGVKALQNVNFECNTGKIHAILGENGAGKSTLIKIISGVVQPNEGQLLLDGKPMTFGHPVEANAAGIVCVFQELSLMPSLTVAENIGITMPTNRFGTFDRKARTERAAQLLKRVGCKDINPSAEVSSLPLSRRQMVEIAKALGRNPKLLILDEATSALVDEDVKKVFAILNNLRQEGLAILYISHRMKEIKELADVLSVFRNGKHVETFPKGAHTDEQIVEMMIGRDLGHAFPPKTSERPTSPTPALRVKNLSWSNQLKDISFNLNKGEILGIGGLDGQGQKELLLALFGVLNDVKGEIELDGKPVKVPSPSQAKDRTRALALVPEDRKTEGLMLPMSIGDNISLASLKGVALDKETEANDIATMVEKLQIKVGNIANPVSSLSGGNQQKVVLAKWLLTNPNVLMLNDPTRGIDVGTKQQLYLLLQDEAKKGKSILFYSTDYNELIGCCDRVLIIYGGSIARELVGEDITEMNILATALNVETAGAKATLAEGARL